MNEITIENLIDRILCATPTEIHQILDTVTERFSELFPDQELLTLSAPGSDPDRQIAELQKVITLLYSLNEK